MFAAGAGAYSETGRITYERQQSRMMDSGVEIAEHDSVAWVTFKRPEKRNAITAEMWDSIHVALTALGQREDIRALAIQGSGGTFSAGADLRSIRNRDGSLSEEYHEWAFRALAAVRKFPRPTVAVIDGPCIGAGCSVALACDVRFASSSATFAVPSASLGIVYEEWSTARLVDLIGSGRTNRFLLSGMRVSAREAEDWGLIERCSDDLATDSETYLRALCAGDPVAIAETRRVIRRLAGPTEQQPIAIPETNTHPVSTA